MESKRRKYRVLEVVVCMAALCTVSSFVVPTLTQASGEEKTVNLIDTLHFIRSQLDIYKAGNNHQLPPAHSQAAFVAALKISGGRGGMFLAIMPANPFNNLNTIRFSSEPNEGSGTAGWHFNTSTGAFRADDTAAHSKL